MGAARLLDGPEDGRWTLLLAHGAGAPMDSPAMTAAAVALGAGGFRVVRFEFDYMAARRAPGGARRAPPKAELLRPEFRAVVADVPAAGPLFIGGKSMGGRVASMVADDLHAEGRVAGLICLGYPFHPPGQPDKLRTGHLAGLATPTLICQGSRDPFGTRDEVNSYDLSPRIEMLWLEDGDHDLKPRKASGFTAADHWRTIAARSAAWAETVAGPGA